MGKILPGNLRLIVLKGIKRSAIKRDLKFFIIPWVLTMTLAMAVAMWEFARGGDPQLTLSTSAVIGLALMISGFPIPLVAVGTLKRSYSATLLIRDDHQLVQHGIFSNVRHPLYTGTIMVLLGMPLCLSSLYGFAVMLLVVPLFLKRIRMEEGLLMEEFGAEYKRYMERSHKLIPFVY